MQTFEKLITVSQDDLDELNHVNNVRYVKWINHVAKEHWLQKATPKMLKDFVWVVIKHHINYKGSALLNDTIKLQTFVTLNKGATCTRIVEMYLHKTNKLLLKSETDFCLLNSKTFKPTRINSEIANLFN
jgi:acyl-CoA thioester hydrolase